MSESNLPPDPARLPDPPSLHASNPDAEEAQALAQNAEWKRVHPLTPLANSWAVFVVLVAIVFSQFGNGDLLQMLFSLGKAGQAWILWLAVVGGIVLLIVLVLLFSLLEWRFTQYALTDEAVLFRKGVIFKSERHMRLNRIQAVDVVAPLVPRLLGLAKLHVDSAGASGSEIDIAFLKVSLCQELRAEVLAKAAGIKVRASSTDSVTNGQINLEVGGAGLVGDLPAALKQAPETTLYEIPVDMITGSILRSFGTWFAVALIPILLLAGLIPAFAIVMSGDKDTFLEAILVAPQALLGVLAGIIAVVSVVFQQINQSWNFTAAVSPDGIRLRHGLTTHDSQTIPPGRVHAVVLKQPFLWRSKDWWKVELTMAGYQGSDQTKKKTTSNVLLPVGTRQQALQSLWMVERNLGEVTDVNGVSIGTAGTQLLETLMYGSGPAPGLFVPPRRDRWLDWITWNRKATVLTTTMVMIRDGRITHRVSFVPHSRMQSVALKQGPLERALGLANVVMHLVPGVVPASIFHLEAPLAQKLWELEVRHADMARDKEPPAQWMQRVVSAFNPADSV